MPSVRTLRRLVLFAACFATLCLALVTALINRWQETPVRDHSVAHGTSRNVTSVVTSPKGLAHPGVRSDAPKNDRNSGRIELGNSAEPHTVPARDGQSLSEQKSSATGGWLFNSDRTNALEALIANPTDNKESHRISQTKSEAERPLTDVLGSGRATGSEKELQDRDRTTEQFLTLPNGQRVMLDIERDLNDRADDAARFYLDQRLPSDETQLPVERYFEAQEQMKSMRRYSTAVNREYPSENDAALMRSDQVQAPEFAWTALGPGNVGGRTRALIIDPNNANIMYAGGVAGGIWKSTDAGASWNPLNDFLANLAVTSLAFEPGNSSVIYAGTGEGFFNIDAVRGAGIFKSTNSGGSWTQLANTANNSNFFFVNDIVVGNGANSQHVYAATRTGVWRSLDGGTTWTQVLVSNAANGNSGAMDLVMRTDQATDYIFASLGQFAPAHVWRNTDAGGAGAWGIVFDDGANVNMGRTSLAIAPSNPSIIYALAASNEAGNYNNGLLGVFRSASNGDAGSWNAQVRNTSANKQDTLLLSNPLLAVELECFGNQFSDSFLNQGWYHNQIAVDPTDATKVWVAGTDVWRSDNSGANWGVASYWWFQGNGINPANNNANTVHADNHTIVFKPGYNGTTNQTMYIGNDGGIFRTDNAFLGNVGYVAGAAATGGTVTANVSPICGLNQAQNAFVVVANAVTWTAINNSYQVTQFFDGVVYPNGTTYFGGTQDNGTNRGTDLAGAGTGPNQWARINGGDGGYVAVNSANTNQLWAETTNKSMVRSTNGGTSFSSVVSTIPDAIDPGGNFIFIAPFAQDPTNPAIMWYGGAFPWRSSNATGGTQTWTQAGTFLGQRITAWGVSPVDHDRVYVGGGTGAATSTDNGMVFTTNIGTTANSGTVWSGSKPRADSTVVSWIAPDPVSATTVYATVSTFNSGGNVGHVFKSTNSGGSWTNINGTGANVIPDIPAHCILINPTNTQQLFLGTDLGVFVSTDGGSNWLQETGFPHTPVESLKINTVGGTTKVYAFTHGRGAYSTTLGGAASPTITNVTSTTLNGSYSAASPVIPIQVTFSENVNVTGTPVLALNSGGNATFAGGSGTSTLTFNYTVGAGQNTADLDYGSTSALSPNGGTIVSSATATAATLTLPSPGSGSSLGGNKNIVIDTTAPTVAFLTSSKANGSYGAGTVISIDVGFTEPITVTGTPTLALNSGGSANCAAGANPPFLTCTYTVAAGQNTVDLDANAANSLTAGTSIKDAAGNDATRTLPIGIAANSLATNKNLIIDTTAPTGVAVAPNVITAGASTHIVTTTFTDNFAVNVTTVAGADIAVTGPNGFSTTAGFANVDVNTNGSPRIATYSMVPPGGSWDAADNGLYTMSLHLGQVTDAAGNAAVNGAIGTFTVNIGGTSRRGDVAPRSTGDGKVQSDDVVQVQRFQIGLDTAVPASNEFLRADSAPLLTNGDGKIQSDDVVQTQRYQIGLDPAQTFSAPPDDLDLTGNKGSIRELNERITKILSGHGLAARSLTLESSSETAGSKVTINVLADARGNESAFGFTLNYDPAIFADPITASAGVAGGSRVCNTAIPGQVICSISNFVDDAAGSSTSQIGEIAAGTNEVLLKVTFTAADGSVGRSGLSLTDVNASDDRASGLPIAAR